MTLTDINGEVETERSMLRADGSLASEAAAGLLSDEQLLEGLRLMLLSRTVDELAVSLQRQGRVNIHAPARGQEAAIVGSALALDPARDWIAPQYREFPAYIRHGLPLVTFWLARLGVGPMGTLPDDLRMLPVQIAIAAQIPQAVGLAWGLTFQGNGGVAITYFGDGASSEGDFHEGANFAGVLKAPLVLFCQNNGWAITTPRSKQTAAPSIASRAVGYGMPGVLVDGNDLFAVYAATSRAVARARAGEGPTLIEAVTYRLGMHNTADDPTRYMSEPEIQSWSQRDPLVRLRTYLRNAGIVDDTRYEALQDEVRTELQNSFREAEAIVAELDPVKVMFDNVYADPPPRLQRQRDEARRWLDHA